MVADPLPEDQSDGNDDTHPQSSDKNEEEADDLANVDSQKTMHDNEEPIILNQDTLQEIVCDVKMEMMQEIEKVSQGTFHNFNKILIEEVDPDTRKKITDSLYEGISYFFGYKYDVPIERVPENVPLEDEEEFSQSSMKSKSSDEEEDDDDEEEQGAKKMSKMKRKRIGDNDEDDDEEEVDEEEEEEEPGAKKMSKMKRKRIEDNGDDDEEEEVVVEKTPKKQKIEVKTSEEEEMDLFADID